MRKNNFIHQRNSKGQILLIVVLTMIVALTVGLSIASRSITNLKISKQNEESQRAFQAAEAGVEKALKTGSTTGADSISLDNQSSFRTTTTSLEGTNFLLNGGELVEQDAGIDVWLSEYPTYNNLLGTLPKPAATLTLYWGEGQTDCGVLNSDRTVSALEVLVLTGNKSSPTLKKYIYDPCSPARISNAGAVTTGAFVVNGVTLKYSNTTQISITNGLIMKIVPIYNSTKIAIFSSQALPPQGSIIESLGKSGDTVRKVQYFSSYPQIPLEIFPYSIISQ